MNAARVALRRTQQGTATLLAAAPRALGARTTRYCSTVAPPLDAKNPEEVCVRRAENVDVVRDAISKLLLKDDPELKPISNTELENSLAKFARLFEEARACINDCKEARAGSLEFYEESYTAQRAVDQAFSCYTDLLDDFRRASDGQLKALGQDRLDLANTLKSLRREVHELQTQPSPKAAGNLA